VSAAHPASGRPLRLGVSTCLLGERVRFDGGDERNRFVADLLRRRVELAPMCPELETELGLARPAMRLAREGKSVRLVEIASRRDHSAPAALRGAAAARAAEPRAVRLRAEGRLAELRHGEREGLRRG
jgi:uncharacterized protein YbbK (DUF523 family)